ncbi:MAG: TAXI family TRAP transporter solute-binding subunit [Sphingobium sp.]
MKDLVGNCAITRRSFCKFSGRLVLASSVTGLVGCNSLPTHRRLSWGSSSLGSTGYVIVEGLTSIVNKYTDISNSSYSTNGSPENMALLGEQTFDIAQTTSLNWRPAFLGQSPYRQPIKAHQLFNYAQWQLPLVVRENSGIDSFEALEGRRIAIGPAAGAGYDCYKLIFEAAGLHDKVQWMFSSWNESYDAVRDGAADATVAIMLGGEIAGGAEELSLSTSLRVIDIPAHITDRAIAENPGLSLTEVSPETFGLIEKSSMIPSFVGIMGCSSAIDEETGYKITKSIFSHPEDIKRLGRLFQFIDLKFALNRLVPFAPVNAGAARYFKEVGIWRDDLLIADI